MTPVTWELHDDVVCVVSESERVVELSRMLSGQPASSAARDHAEELLAAASRQRGS